MNSVDMTREGGAMKVQLSEEFRRRAQSALDQMMEEGGHRKEFSLFEGRDGNGVVSDSKNGMIVLASFEDSGGHYYVGLDSSDV